jgi:L-erythro-3,5-diaminohexanoate dehydrogenase
MKVGQEELEERLGADRVIDPPGALPQPADRLDASGPVRDFEIEIRVERLCLDSTSFRNIRETAEGDPDRMAERVIEIVAARGKMHNPETDSGGVLQGTVAAVGGRRDPAPELGEPIVTLGSLTLTPLRLERVVRVDPESPQVEAAGTAYVSGRAGWAPLPADLPIEAAIDLLDVCAAASQVRALARPGQTILVLGVGHAGKLALAAARDCAPAATLVAADVDREELDRIAALGLCDVAVAADLRDPLAATAALAEAGVPAADLTVVVVNAAGCESAAILSTAGGGTVLFFSMATSFSAAALAADGIGTDVRMLVGSGHSPDRGEYALHLVRTRSDLRDALGIPAVVGARGAA